LTVAKANSNWLKTTIGVTAAAAAALMTQLTVMA